MSAGCELDGEGAGTEGVNTNCGFNPYVSCFGHPPAHPRDHCRGATAIYQPGTYSPTAVLWPPPGRLRQGSSITQSSITAYSHARTPTHKSSGAAAGLHPCSPMWGRHCLLLALGLLAHSTAADEPRFCCMAMIASCLACSAGMEIGQYCTENPQTQGCESCPEMAPPGGSCQPTVNTQTCQYNEICCETTARASTRRSPIAPHRHRTRAHHHGWSPWSICIAPKRHRRRLLPRRRRCRHRHPPLRPCY